jgi:DNA-binding beta-propeller fold protein YncE
MNDGDNSGGATPGDDLIHCALQGGGSVTAIHNSHLGPGGTPPTVLGTTCLLADGHKVAAFSSGAGVPKRVFVSSEDAGEISVIDDDEASADYRKVIARIDLCKTAKEAGPCDDETGKALTVGFTPNNSAPHGIRWSKLTKKIYSIQEGYGEIAEIDPSSLAVTNTFDLAGTPYTAYGISADGKYLLLRGQTAAPQTTRLGVIDLSAAVPAIADLTIPELAGTSPGSFKFSPDGKRFYILAGNAGTATKKNRLFAFDWATVAPPAVTLLKEIPLAGTDVHSFDVLIQGAGQAAYLVVSNGTPGNSISIINATDNLEKQTVPVGPNPTGIMVFSSGAAIAGNQATSSLTGGSAAAPSVLPERLDDHGMPE